MLAVLASLSLSFPSGFLSRLSALLSDEGFKRVSSYEGENGGFGYIIAEFELNLSGNEDSHALMDRVAEQFGVQNKHKQIRSDYPLITDSFTVSEGDSTYNVYLEHELHRVAKGEYSSQSFLVVVQTDTFPRPTFFDSLRGLWPW